MFIIIIFFITDELYLALVMSTKAHANILKVDPSEALKLKGVKQFISYQDVPGSNKTGVFGDEEIFASKKVSVVKIALDINLCDCQLFKLMYSFNQCKYFHSEILNTISLFPITGFTFQVFYEGAVVGAIVADTQAHAQRATKAVKIEYEELQPILTIEVCL